MWIKQNLNMYANLDEAVRTGVFRSQSNIYEEACFIKINIGYHPFATFVKNFRHRCSTGF